MRQRPEKELRRRDLVSIATTSEVLMRCAAKTERVCNEFAHFLAEELHEFGAKRVRFQRQTQCRLERELRRRRACCAEGARLVSACALFACCASKSQKICNKFERCRRKFCASATPTARVFGLERANGSIKGCTDVVRFSQRRWAKF